MLLGDSNSHDEATYYLPMLPVLEERGKTDAESRQRAEELQKLPAIKQLTIDNSYDLPSSARADQAVRAANAATRYFFTFINALLCFKMNVCSLGARFSVVRKSHPSSAGGAALCRQRAAPVVFG